ncbi:MAG TPA: N-acyl homoserine lactonase family protein [Candidatus Limnocylindrales bacterium]|nr:N-acyl homoserine lactonase family protein [Candidatus Limnocylindrales bacterium]
MIDASDIVRLRMGFAIAPAQEGAGHTGERLMMCAYVIHHPNGIFLFDTGIGRDPIVDDLYAPVRWELDDQLAAVGLARSDVIAVANCHLHFDHAGGNALFPGIPVFVQRIEHQTALLTEDYTIPGIADFPGARYELLDGDAPIWPGLTVLPTPGHTAGHQSLVVETRQGRVVLAGQSFDSASEYARARLSQELDQAGYGEETGYPAWMNVVDALDPWRVLFAHDVASWERGPGIPARRGLD